jgi:hypothetical protein
MLLIQVIVTVNCGAGKPEYGTGLVIDGPDMFRFDMLV